MLTDDFDELNAKVKIKANPSNQNFHRRLIRAFGTEYQVSVISYRALVAYNEPAFLPHEWKRQQKITYHYLPVYNRKYIKQKRIVDDGMKLINEFSEIKRHPNAILVVDAINGTLRRLALKARKRFHIKTLAIVTDNPLLLSGANKKSATSAIKEMQQFDYYLSLTEALDVMANPHHRPHLNFPGVIEDRKCFSSYPRPYLFFAGAMHERYGVNNLITAFMNTTYDVDLLIAGHGPSHFVEQSTLKDKRIKFIGQLTQEATYKYEAGSLLNINPRPYDRKLDIFSVPSKFFEYMTSGAPTMSTEHSLLTPQFQKLAIWAGQGSIMEIRTALIEFMEMSPASRDRMAKRAKEAVLTEFGIEAIAKKLNQFISSLK